MHWIGLLSRNNRGDEVASYSQIRIHRVSGCVCFKTMTTLCEMVSLISKIYIPVAGDIAIDRSFRLKLPPYSVSLHNNEMPPLPQLSKNQPVWVASPAAFYSF